MNNESKLIAEEIKNSGGNLSHVARVLGVDYHALKQRFPQHTSTLPVNHDPEPDEISMLGRKGFRQYVIAVKRSGHAWPEKYKNAIEDARKKFDAGTHEMFQTNWNGWVVQYLIPYLVPRDRRQFFSTMVRM
jgi:hypothetical protein